MSTTIVDDRLRLTSEHQYGPLGPYAVELDDDVLVAADDGFELKGTLALPVGVDRAPAVLIRTPYNRTYFVGEVIVWASHGYACLIQDTRTTTSYFDEVADGPATVRWIEHQPWFNGRLGLTGDSYLAFAAWATASTRPASLKAIATAVYSADRVSSWYPGGSFGLELALSWAASQQADGADNSANPYNHLPLNEADVAATGGKLEFYQEQLAYDADDPHWQPLNFTDLLDALPVPLLHVDGWYDYHRTYFWQDFERLNRHRGDMPHRLVIGPWPHAGFDRRIAMAEKLAWFDTHLRGDGNRTFGALRYYRTGVDPDWKDLETWQEPEAVSFYATTGQQLLPANASAGGRVQWTYDPSDPTPSVGMSTLGFDHDSTPSDNSSLEERSDVRTFTSTSLLEPLDLAGHVTATTTFYSDAPSADLFLRLLDVYEDGRVQNVADGILRVTDPALSDGVAIRVDLGPVGHRFAAGHRLRLLVASGAHPYYNRNLGNGEPTATATQIRIAQQAVAVGGDDGLRVSLPVAH